MHFQAGVGTQSVAHGVQDMQSIDILGIESVHCGSGAEADRNWLIASQIQTT